MSALAITVEGEAIPVRPNKEHEYVLETKLVAKGYGVRRGVIQDHKRLHADELVEGKHWVVEKIDTLGGSQKAVFWTKRGVVRLGFFIKSERAKRFRDAAEDLIVNGGRPAVSEELLLKVLGTLEKISAQLAETVAKVSEVAVIAAQTAKIVAAQAASAPALYVAPATTVDLCAANQLYLLIPANHPISDVELRWLAKKQLGIGGKDVFIGLVEHLIQSGRVKRLHNGIMAYARTSEGAV